MNRLGKCTNYAGCVRAYKSDEINVSGGAFVCPDCRHPLTIIETSSSRKASGRLLPGLVILAAVGIVAAGGAHYFRSRVQVQRPADSGPTPTPLSAPFSAPSSTPMPTPLSESSPASSLAESTPAPVSSAAPSASPEAAAESPPPLPVATPGVGPMEFNVENKENRDVKNEVLKRIDLMPTISSENKDKLYMNVERARRMGKVMTIPFASGKTSLGPSVELLESKMQTPAIQQLLQDPTVVLVILGYADTKGDDKTNLRISQSRAQNVLDILRDKCAIANVLHSVGMGGSTLFDAQGSEKNRVVEIWAVLP